MNSPTTSRWLVRRRIAILRWLHLEIGILLVPIVSFLCATAFAARGRFWASFSVVASALASGPFADYLLVPRSESVVSGLLGALSLVLMLSPVREQWLKMNTRLCGHSDVAWVGIPEPDRT